MITPKNWSNFYRKEPCKILNIGQSLLSESSFAVGVDAKCPRTESLNTLVGRWK